MRVNNIVIESEDGTGRDVHFAPSSNTTNKDSESLNQQSQQFHLEEKEDQCSSSSNSGKENSLLPTDPGHSNANVSTAGSLQDSQQLITVPSSSSSSSSSDDDEFEKDSQPSSSTDRRRKNSSPRSPRSPRTAKQAFTCKECSKTFSHQNTLNQHRKVHFPPQFKCDFCPKMFTYKQVRDIHMYTHTGEKPFECKQCDESVANPGSLSQHRMKHLKRK